MPIQTPDHEKLLALQQLDTDDLIALLTKPRGKCGGLPPREYVGLATVGCLLEAIPRGKNLSYWPSKSDDLQGFLPDLLKFLNSKRDLFERVGFGAVATTSEQRLVIGLRAGDGTSWRLVEQADGRFAWFKADESGRSAEVRANAAPSQDAGIILFRVVQWWRDFSHPDHLDKHPHFDCCIYPVMTNAMGLPTLEETRVVVAEAAELAGIVYDSESQWAFVRELTLEVCQELAVEKHNGLVWRRQDSSLAYNKHAVKDLLEKHRKGLAPISGMERVKVLDKEGRPTGEEKTAHAKPVSLDAPGAKSDGDAPSLSKAFTAPHSAPDDEASSAEADRFRREAEQAMYAVAEARRGMEARSKDVRAVRKHMMSLIRETITLAEVARREGCSTGNLSRAYQKEREVYQHLPEVQRLNRASGA